MMRAACGMNGPERGPRARRSRWLAATFLLAVAGGFPHEAEAQRFRSGGLEISAVLQEAAEQENNGDLDGAEATLRALLERRPTSTGAVFALERVLRAKGELKGLIQVLDAHLAANPAASAARFTKLKVLAELKDDDGVQRAVAEWRRAEPDSPDPFREAARIYEESSGPERALAILSEGLAELGESGPLLIEQGDILLSQGKASEGARSWARALGPDRAQTQAVLRRIENLEEGRDEVVSDLLTVLGSEPTSTDRLEVGYTIALRENLESEAQELAGKAAAKSGNREAKAFLTAFARKAEELDRTASARWAYGQVRERTSDAVEGRATDQRLVETSLALQDTLGAYEAQHRITESYPPRSSDRMRSWAQELRLQVSLVEPSEVRQNLDDFRNDFPDSPELDDLAATVASRLLGRGERQVALDVLAGIEGPGANLERAYLLLEAGSREDGLAALEASIPELDPADATEVIALMLLLTSLTPEGAQVAADLAISAHRGNPGSGLLDVEVKLDALQPQDQPAILALAARTADQAGDGALGMIFRRRILTEHPDAPELPDAALQLARSLAASPAGVPEARSILEDLIVNRPESPIVPDARRELRRLTRELGGGAG